MLIRRIIQRWLGYGDIAISPYYVYQIGNQIYLRGRALRGDDVVHSPHDSWFKNFSNMMKRLLSDELPHAIVKVSAMDNKNLTIQADAQGFFELNFQTEQESVDTIDLSIDPEDLRYSQNSEVHVQTPVTRFSERSKFGIISDIDDTILETGVVSKFKWRLIYNSLFVGPYGRKSFPRTSAMFQKLELAGNSKNPIFYISNSPWNMFEYLREYLSYQGFPDGIVLLRNINFLKWKSKKLEKQNKYREILKTLDAHHRLAFILIGDGGEVDVDIYLRIAEKQPNRVKAIYIRSVADKKRMVRITEVVKGVTNIPILIFDHTVEMAEHAKRMGIV